MKAKRDNLAPLREPPIIQCPDCGMQAERMAITKRCRKPGCRAQLRVYLCINPRCPREHFTLPAPAGGV